MYLSIARAFGVTGPCTRLDFPVFCHSRLLLLVMSSGLSGNSAAVSKRKGSNQVRADEKRQRTTRMDDYFSHRVTIENSPSMDRIMLGESGGVTDVVLTQEQGQVLKMVVDEGKSMFFTGSAGKLRDAGSPMDAGALLNMSRHGKVTASQGYHCVVAKEVQRGTKSRGSYGEYGHGCISHWRFVVFEIATCWFCER